MQTVLLQGIPIETIDAGAAAVVRLQAELVGAEAKVAVKDDEIDAIRRRHATELAAVVAHSLDVEELDEAVASRIALIGAARSIQGADFDLTGKPDMVIRRFAAEQKLGEAKLADKDDAYVTIVFDTMPLQLSIPIWSRLLLRRLFNRMMPSKPTTLQRAERHSAQA